MDKSACVDFEMQNGTVQLTLTFYKLNQLKTKHKKEYERYFEMQKTGVHTDLDAVEVLYIAYLCANMEKMPDVMSYEEWLQNMKNGRKRVWDAYAQLYADAKN